ILWLISLVHVFTDPEDSAHLFNLLSSPFYRMPSVDLALLGGAARSNKRPLFTIILHRKTLPVKQDLSEGGEKILKKFLKDLQHYTEKTHTLRAGELIYDFLENSGFLRSLASQE